MTRSTAAEGTGVDSPREQVNVVSSYIDAWAVYGGSEERLDWLRDGTLDGDPTNNDATLLDVDGYLPTAAARPGRRGTGNGSHGPVGLRPDVSRCRRGRACQREPGPDRRSHAVSPRTQPDRRIATGRPR